MLNIDDIQSKINYFIMNNPEYRMYNNDALISVLADKEFLTEEEVNVLKNGLSVFYNNSPQESSADYKEIFGASFAKKSKLETPKARIDDLLNSFNLTLNSDLTINMDNYSLENLIKKFNIKPDDVWMYDTENFSYDVRLNYPDIGEIVLNVSNNSPKEIIISNKFFTLTLAEEGRSFYEETIWAGEDEICRKRYDIQGNITLEFSSGKTITYLNNYPFEEFNNGKYKNLLVEDLVKDLSILSFKKDLKTNILARITKENANEVVSEFEYKTGKDLFDEITKSPFIDRELKPELLKHLKNVYPQYLATSLIEDIYGLGSGDLEDNLKLLDKDNIQEVLYFYKALAMQKDEEFYNTFKLSFSDDLFIVPTKLVDYLNGNMGNGIIKNISDEWGLSSEDKSKLIDSIIQIVLESIDSNAKIYAQDIKNDILVHKDDADKLDVDLIRWSKRLFLNLEKKTSQSNGKIDETYKQGFVGDCWLLSGITSILNKENGKEYIESLINSDPEKDYVEVTLPGVGKTYQIKKDYIENCPQLAVGDGDIRAIELAVDTYLKEIAYENNARVSNQGKVCDIDGNLLPIVFRILLGNGSYFDPTKIDLNNKNVVYTVGLNEDLVNNVMSNANTELNVSKLISHHAYSVIKKDDEFLYLFNPHDTVNLNKIDEETFIKVPLDEAKYLECSAANIPVILR